MNIKQLLADEDAVSPVIGVILMVAITVILAAVIGTFVLGLGDQVQNNAPQASFTFDFTEGNTGTCDASSETSGTDGELVITHDGGDKIDGTKLSIKAVGGTAQDWTSCGGGSDVTAGDTADATVNSADEIRVLWQAGQGNSATLGKWTGPDA